MPRIYGERVMLREYRESDFEHIRRWVNNPEIVKYLSDIFLYPQSEKQTRDFLERAMSKEWKGFIIADRETGEYIGQVDFVNLDEKNGYGELGIVIGDLDQTSKGLGSEALELFLDFGFNQLRLNRIELVCWSYNKRAQRAYEKVGFKKEGIRRQKYFRDGRYFDEYLYGILKEEWQERRTD
ncbi:MAG: hypothetical protein PWR10_753 [Halanaerobiales bacterium]|nr:hypothetical protein [Halanaerobiales bacterium]